MNCVRLISFVLLVLLVAFLAGCAGRGLFSRGQGEGAAQDAEGGDAEAAAGIPVISAMPAFDGEATEGIPGKPGIGLFEQEDAILRYRMVDVGPGLKRAAGLKKGDGVSAGDLLLLNLFSDAEYLALVKDVSVNVQGTLTIWADIKDLENAFILSVSDGRFLGLLRFPEKDLLYQLISRPESKQHYLLEFRISDMDVPEGGGPLMPPGD